MAKERGRKLDGESGDEAGGEGEGDDGEDDGDSDGGKQERRAGVNLPGMIDARIQLCRKRQRPTSSSTTRRP